MVLAQSALDSVRADALIGALDNSSVVVSVPERMLVQSRENDIWTIRARVAQEVLNIEEATHDPTILELLSGLMIDKLAEAVSTSQSLITLEIERKLLRLPKRVDSSTELQKRLRARWPTVIAQARKMQDQFPDPVQSLINLLGDMPGDYDTWREILEEPYG